MQNKHLQQTNYGSIEYDLNNNTTMVSEKVFCCVRIPQPVKTYQKQNFVNIISRVVHWRISLPRFLSSINQINCLHKVLANTLFTQMFCVHYRMWIAINWRKEKKAVTGATQHKQL